MTPEHTITISPQLRQALGWVLAIGLGVGVGGVGLRVGETSTPPAGLTASGAPDDRLSEVERKLGLRVEPKELAAELSELRQRLAQLEATDEEIRVRLKSLEETGAEGLTPSLVQLEAMMREISNRLGERP